jgi:transposase
MLTNGQWAALEPLIEACRPPAKVAPQNLRHTMSAILWRHQNGDKWRAVPEVLGPCWKATQTFIRWSRLEVWERMMALAQKNRVALAMTFLDGTNIRAHQKAAGAPRKRIRLHNATGVRRWADPGAASAPRPA